MTGKGCFFKKYVSCQALIQYHNMSSVIDGLSSALKPYGYLIQGTLLIPLHCQDLHQFGAEQGWDRKTPSVITTQYSKNNFTANSLPDITIGTHVPMQIQGQGHGMHIRTSHIHRSPQTILCTYNKRKRNCHFPCRCILRFLSLE